MSALTTQSRTCPCGRILLATRDGRWPHHYADIEGQVWCPCSGKPIVT